MICFFNNYANGDFITQMMLIRAIKKIYPDLEISCCAFEEHLYMIDPKLCKPILLEETRDKYHDVIYGRGCDPKIFSNYIISIGLIPFYTWLGLYDDTHDHSWENTIEIYNRQCDALNLPYKIDIKTVPIPFYNFPTKDNDYRSRIPHWCSLSIDSDNNYTVKIPNKVYYDNCEPRSGHSRYEWTDYEIFKSFPNINFFITQKIEHKLKNVIDVSNMNLSDLSQLSSQCSYIFGRGSGPFFCTFNQKNMHKPRYLLNFKNLVKKAKNEEWSFVYDGIKIYNLKSQNDVFNVLKNL